MPYCHCILHFLDENWVSQEKQMDDDMSELIQHEYDHLDGILATMWAIDNKSFVNVSSNSSRAREIGFEYKSKRMFNGVPMIHINLGGIVPRRAKGIIAIGDIAVGVIAMGGVSAGVVSVGGVSAGLVSLGGLATGLIVALGGVAVAPIALGGLAIGVIACGGAALGYITNLK